MVEKSVIEGENSEFKEESTRRIRASIDLGVANSLSNQSVWRYEEDQVSQNISRLKEINKQKTHRQKSNSPRKLIIKPAVSIILTK